MERVTCIYKIQSKSKPERVYVGQAVNFVVRRNKHLRELRNNTHHSARLQSHYNKYGVEDLEFTVLEMTDRLQSVLDARENYYMDCFKCEDVQRPWFNMCPTASSCLGYKHTEEARANVSKALKGKPKNYSPEQLQALADRMKGNQFGVGRICSAESKRKMSLAQKGRKHTEEAKEKNRQAHLGQVAWNKGTKGVVVAWNKGLKGVVVVSDETRAKLSLALSGENNPNYGRPQSEEVKEKNRLAHIGKQPWITGRHHSEEAKEKISLKKRGVPLSEEHKLQLSIAGMGRVVSEETKRKISETEKRTKNSLKVDVI